MKDEYILVTL